MPRGISVAAIALLVLMAAGCASSNPNWEAVPEESQPELLTSSSTEAKEAKSSLPVAPAGWQLQNAIPQAGTIDDIEVINERTAWAVGGYGTILKSRDGIWSAQPSGTLLDLCAISAVDGERAWVVGVEGLVLSTSDGGNSWKANSLNYSRPTSVCAVDERNIWITSDGGTYQTKDGGLTWNNVHFFKWAYEILANIESCASGDIWAFGGVIRKALVMKGKKGGTSWTDRSPQQIVGQITASCAADENTALIFITGDDRHKLMKTDDGGRSWRTLTQFPTGFLVLSMFAVDRNVIWISGEASEGVSGTLVTRNGGRTWDENPSDNVAKTVAAANYNVAWEAGPSIYCTSDAGKNWSLQVEAIANKAISSMSVTGDGTVWAGCGSDLVLRSPDRGESWQQSRPGRKRQDAASLAPTVSAADGQSAWVRTGSRPHLMRTSDGGTSWQEMVAPVDTITDFDSPDSNTLWLLSGRSISRTVDGGSTWLYAGFGKKLDAEDIRVIQAVDENISWASGTGELVLITRDGGVTWQVVHNETKKKTSGLVTPAFWVSRTIGYADVYEANCGSERPDPLISASDAAAATIAVSSGKSLTYTRDGGATWQDISPAEFGAGSVEFQVSRIAGVRMVDSDTIWAWCSVSQSKGTLGNSLFLTRDGGQSWSREDFTQKIHSFAASEDAVWLGLDNGFVMMREY
ncbi:MAG: YCF48-related protein [Candidatus Geothermincolia bacterium]